MTKYVLCLTPLFFALTSCFFNEETKSRFDNKSDDESYESQIEELENLIEELEVSNSNLEDHIDELTYENDALESRIDELLEEYDIDDYEDY